MSSSNSLGFLVRCHAFMVIFHISFIMYLYILCLQMRATSFFFYFYFVSRVVVLLWVKSHYSIYVKMDFPTALAFVIGFACRALVTPAESTSLAYWVSLSGSEIIHSNFGSDGPSHSILNVGFVHRSQGWMKWACPLIHISSFESSMMPSRISLL